MHVREIVADTFAFQFLWEEIVESLSDDSFGASASKDVEVALKAAGFISALEFVQLYFWLSASMPATRATFVLAPKKYPPQAFRMQAVESTALEHAGRVLPSGLGPMLLEQAIGEKSNNLQ